jgi:hypothetical protein
VDRHGRVQDIRLSGEAVALVVRKRVAAAGLDPAPYFGQSLGRAGNQARAGVPHQGSDPPHLDAMLARYIRDRGAVHR